MYSEFDFKVDLLSTCETSIYEVHVLEEQAQEEETETQRDACKRRPYTDPFSRLAGFTLTITLSAKAAAASRYQEVLAPV